jgi:hypothetical protein
MEMPEIDADVDYVLRLEQAVAAYAITCEMYECSLTALYSDYENMAAEHAVVPDPNIVDTVKRLRYAAGMVAEKFPVAELGVCHALFKEV